MKRTDIDLDQLLTGTPTWTQVQEYFANGEFYEEHYLVEAIEKYLLTPEQREWMAGGLITIEKMLNGRCHEKQIRVRDEIFEAWNTKLGFKHFRF